MAVYHVLKDGTRCKDIRGHVVKINDCRSLYKLIGKITERQSNNEKREVEAC